MEATGGVFSLVVGLVFMAGIMHLTRNFAINGNLQRNSAIGINTKVTKSSDLAWKAGHQAAGPWLLMASWTGYFAGLLAAIIATVQLATGAVNAAVLAIPITGYVSVIALLLIATKKANEAGSAAEVADERSGEK